MAYDARGVANYFLTLAEKDHNQIFPLKMQKLAYLAHGWNLARRGEPLIRNDFEAWQYGPVVPELYHALKKYGAAAITQPISGFDPTLDDESSELVNAVWKRYCPFTGIQLSAFTHEPGYAWDLTIKNKHPFWGSPVISNELIADEFQRRANQAK